jgi:hypothetical protein
VPTILRIGPFRFYFHSHEPNEPPHVHVDRDDATIKVWLNPVGVAKSRGFRAHEISGIVTMVEENRGALLEAWHDYFG